MFLLIPLLALVYTAWHIWLIVPFTTAWRWVIAVLWCLSVCSIFLDFMRVLDRFPLWLGTVFYEIGTSALFVMLYLTMIFVVLDVLRLLRIVSGGVVNSNLHMTLAITIGLTALFVYGNIHYKKKYREEISLETKKPHDGKTLTIVMASDLHLGYHNNLKELKRWVELINKENPDLVVIGGDIIDISTRPLIAEGMASEFKRINAPIYACLGNHEYYAGSPEARQFYASAGIHLLVDSVATVKGITLIGRDDRTNPHRQNLQRLMQGVDKSRFMLLIDHQPYNLEQAEKAGIDFQFSGHTHHGQVWPISWVTERIYEDAFGPLQKGHTRYYVSSGLGIWGGKFRIGTRSEYVVVRL